MRRSIPIWLTALLIILAAAPVMAGEYTGSIQGLKCVTQGKVCPVDQEDPMAALEDTYVLVGENGDWFMLPGINQNLLARLLNRQVKVLGEKSPRYNSIKASELQVKAGDGWKTSWSPQLEMQLRRDFEWLKPPYPPTLKGVLP